MSSATIEAVTAVLAFDSRGTPTVSCRVELASGVRADAMAPAGASTGSHEVVELRDGGDAFGGRGVERALGAIRTELARAVVGMDAREQRALDDALTACDGTVGLGRLGANAVLSVSAAAALAAAEDAAVPAYSYFAAANEPLLPLPMVNIFSGGAHAAGALDVQDILIIPLGAGSFREAIEWVWEVRHRLESALLAQGHQARLVADEGGFGIPLETNRQGLELLTEAIIAVGLRPGVDMGIGLDVAATEFYRDGHYVLASEARELTGQGLVEELAAWCRDFAVVSIEDAAAEDDWATWAHATDSLGGVQLIGDDLFVTSTERLAQGVDAGVANSVLVKPNQCGTMTAAHDVVELAHRAGYSTVLSARSGETEESWLADLAVGWRTGQIKVGSLTRSERTAKWNRLLRIEAELGTDATYAGGAALRPRIQSERGALSRRRTEKGTQ